jgi:hypothetical protein
MSDLLTIDAMSTAIYRKLRRLNVIHNVALAAGRVAVLKGIRSVPSWRVLSRSTMINLGLCAFDSGVVYMALNADVEPRVVISEPRSITDLWNMHLYNTQVAAGLRPGPMVK